MKQPVFTGAATAIVTPFQDGVVNFSKLEEMIAFQIQAGIDAIVVCGTTGEASTLPDEEHKQVMAFTVKKVAGRVPVIAGVGSNDTKHAIMLSQYAQDIGADALLSVTPYYNKTTQAGLCRHFEAIAKSVKAPIILYNVPSRTNLNIDPQTLLTLSQIDNIVGVKECNFAQVGAVKNLCGEHFALYSGEDALVLPMLSMGGIGVISVAANIIPKDMHDLVAAFMEDNIEKSRQLQLGMVPLIDALFCEVNPIPIKAAMNLMGMDVGPCRLPLTDMSPGNLQKLKAALKNYGLL